MNILDLAYPAPLICVPEWDIQDSTKLAEAQCLRRYFYRYVLGWVTEFPNNHLIFGRAWHVAMEHLLLGIKTQDFCGFPIVTAGDSSTAGYSTTLLSEAYDLFLADYREDLPPDTDDTYAPKNPDNALIALAQYADEYRSDEENTTVLYTEVAGSVPVGEDRLIHFKIDAILDTQFGILIRDHKTTGWDSTTSRSQWSLNTQVNNYLHVLYCIFQDEDPTRLYGLEVNLAILRKKGNLFIRIPIKKTPEQLQVHLWRINYKMHLLEWNFQALSDSSVDDEVLQCFPQEDGRCTAYNRLCPYHAFCVAPTFANPLRRCESPPPGFKVEHWNPREREEDAKFVYKDGSLEEKERSDES